LVFVLSEKHVPPNKEREIMKKPNYVFKHSYLHKLIRGHYRERAFLWTTKDGYERWSYQCPVCPTYCEREEQGYNHSKTACSHK
jgi:hypothetical protein